MAARDRNRRALRAGEDRHTPPVPPALVGTIEGTPDDTATKILVAAAELFTQRSPSEVSLREVAAKAGVNYGLIHRYFGTKEGLLVALFRQYVVYGGHFIHGRADIHEAIAESFAADSGKFAHMLAWAALDGTAPERVFPDSTAMQAYRALLERHWRDREPVPEVRAEFDGRVVSAFLMLVTMVWDFYAPYLQVLTEFEDRDLVDVRQEVLELMQLLAYATAPRSGARADADPGTRS